jgi:hypothetical protein
MNIPSVPTIKFLTFLGTDVGICPRCNHQGAVGKFCYRCCSLADQVIGTCPDCNDCGRLGSRCEACPNGPYEDAGPWGTCGTCGHRGISRQPCNSCRVDGRDFEHTHTEAMRLRSVKPSIKFLPDPETDTGTCPLCNRHGRVGKFCHRCCFAAGQVIGYCDVCDDFGQIGRHCPDCPYEYFIDEVEALL